MRKHLLLASIGTLLVVILCVAFMAGKVVSHPSNFKNDVTGFVPGVTTATEEIRITASQSTDVFPLEREANEVAWVPDQSAFYTHGGDRGRKPGYVDSDSGIYKYVPGSNPVKVADLPSPIHHTGFAYNYATGKIYTYAGGEIQTAGDHHIFWFDPRDNSTGTCTEVYPYDAVSVVAEYSIIQQKTYLFGGFNSNHVYFEIWIHDPVSGTVTKSNTLMSQAFSFQATVYVEPEDAIYLIGGIDINGTSRTEIYKFDCATESITQLNVTTPDNKTKGMGAYYDPDLNIIVIAGGRNGNPWTGYTARIWTLDLSDYSVRIMKTSLPSFVDDLAGGYANGKGYFMRVTPTGYNGYSRREPYCFGDNQCYICVITRE